MRFLPFLFAALAAAGCSTASEPKSSTEPVASAPAPLPAGLERVAEPNLVCMVNDRYMGVPQIPVEVGARTYFGCCEACKGRLATDAAVRVARDPVSGATVDKAVAVLARDASGAMLYFASEETLRAYRP